MIISKAIIRNALRKNGPGTSDGNVDDSGNAVLKMPGAVTGSRLSSVDPEPAICLGTTTTIGAGHLVQKRLKQCVMLAQKL